MTKLSEKYINQMKVACEKIKELGKHEAPNTAFLQVLQERDEARKCAEDVRENGLCGNDPRGIVFKWEQADE